MLSNETDSTFNQGNVDDKFRFNYELKNKIKQKPTLEEIIIVSESNEVVNTV